MVLVLHGLSEPDDDDRVVGARDQQQEQSSERRPRHGWNRRLLRSEQVVSDLE
jgi:hypothetical protein